MEVTTGLFEGMVLQRTKQNVCDVSITGQCQAKGAVVVRVAGGKKKIKSLTNVKTGQAARGRFVAHLKGLPVGGPYTVELRIDGSIEKIIVRNVYVGDVWILGGQSNMEGRGLLAGRLKPNPKVRAFYMDDHWAAAEDPIHQLWKAVDPVHDGIFGRSPSSPDPAGAGPGVAFGQDMLAATGVPQGLIACAHGGTSMSQWDPKLKKLGGKSLYGATVRRFHKNGAKVAGVIWYQGCSDTNDEAAPLYTRRMKAMIAAMRRDFGDPNLPVVIAQIARVLPSCRRQDLWNSIQDQQRHLGLTVRHLATAPTVDLVFEDGIHVSAKGCHVLGKRLARAMRGLIQGRRAGKPPIALKSVRMMADPDKRLYNLIIVEFSNVEGKLVAGSRPTGFALADSSGPVPFIFRIELDGSRAILYTTTETEALNLHYGYGCNPYCNITDQAGRSLPVFGPVLVGRQRAFTPFVQEFLVSDFLPAPEKLIGLEYRPVASLNLKPRKFVDNFCDRSPEIANTKGQVGAYYFAGRFRCDEDMKLRALLGYDGAIKVWMDGREIFFDPEGTNPARTCDAAAPFAASAGEHEILITLSNNGGYAYGVYLRLERRDVSPAAIRKGPVHYKLPTFTPVVQKS